MTRRIVQGFVLGPSLLLVAATHCFSQARPNIDPPIERNVRLERTAAERLARVKAVLPAEAKRKLAVAVHQLIRILVKQTPVTNVLTLARAEAEGAISGMSEAQVDVTTFFLLAEVTRIATSLLSREGDQETLDSMTDLSEPVQTRLQMLMDRRSTLVEALSNIMKKISNTNDDIVQNLK